MSSSHHKVMTKKNRHSLAGDLESDLANGVRARGLVVALRRVRGAVAVAGVDNRLQRFDTVRVELQQIADYHLVVAVFSPV